MHPIVPRVLRGDRRAVARAMTLIENDTDAKRSLLEGFYTYAGRAHIIGLTGAPGAGKSTLVDQLIAHLRRDGKKVGVLAVDPSSPFTGGALLGDRVRMLRHSADDGVYIRSMGSRGSLGGLAKSTREVLYVLEAYGCDVILLETVGVGQSELDVMTVADTVALVLTPGAGDHVQTAKAGIMEIADLFVVNKQDLPGADALVRELQLMIHDKRVFREDWQMPIVRTNATEGQGIDALWRELVRHHVHLHQSGFWQQRRQQRHRDETLRILESRFRAYLVDKAHEDQTWQSVLLSQMDKNPYEAAEVLMSDLPFLSESRDVEK